jgi:PTH1 family peptidyl-tRNA hydrolase
VKPHLVIVGLGNPGASYVNTRHNVGFKAVEALSEAFGAGEWKESQKYLCRMQEARIITVPALLVQPSTFMNRSGECIRKLVEFYKLNPREQVLVVSDDIDLPLGDVRLRMKGGPGTHNGLRSIVVVLGEEFPRLRIGIGPAPKGDELAAWVLSALSPKEKKSLAAILKDLPEKVREFVMERVED